MHLPRVPYVEKARRFIQARLDWGLVHGHEHDMSVYYLLGWVGLGLALITPWLERDV
jgi:hypothetical protein